MPHVTRSRDIIADMVVEDTESTPLWEVLVPTEGNDGTPFKKRHHKAWDRFVTSLAGGMTLVRPVRGTWVDRVTSDKYTERVIPVRIMCTEAQIIEICKETARHYDQIAVMASLVSERNVLVRNPAATCGRCWSCMAAQGVTPYGYVLCPDCGNKRCPKAEDHLLACTHSNEPGQPGALHYPAVDHAAGPTIAVPWDGTPIEQLRESAGESPS